MDPAVQPRHGGAAPTSTTSSWSPTSPARPSGTSRAEPRWRPTPRARRRRPRDRGRRAAQGRRPRRPPLHAAVLLLRRATATSHVVLAADYVTTEDGTGIVHIAPAFGEEDKASPTSGSSPSSRSAPTALHLPRHRLRGPARLRRQPARSSTHLKAATRGEGDHGAVTDGHGAAAPRDLRPLVPALLALPRAPHLHGGVVVVRRGHEVQGPDGRAQPGDHLGARARQGRPVRQVARERPRLVDLAEPLLGQPDPGVEVRQPGVPADRRLRLVRGARARLRRARGHGPAPPVHRPA